MNEKIKNEVLKAEKIILELSEKLKGVEELEVSFQILKEYLNKVANALEKAEENYQKGQILLNDTSNLIKKQIDDILKQFNEQTSQMRNQLAQFIENFSKRFEQLHQMHNELIKNSTQEIKNSLEEIKKKTEDTSNSLTDWKLTFEKQLVTVNQQYEKILQKSDAQEKKIKKIFNILYLILGGSGLIIFLFFLK